MSYADTPQGREAAALLTRVRSAMADQGVTQSELARRSGYGRSYVSMLLNDRDEGERREITLPTALHLAHVLCIVRIVEENAR